jgi:hypothetical protein
LKAGAFYSSQGPQIENIEVSPDEVLVECSPARAVMISGPGLHADKVLGAGIRAARLRLQRFTPGHFRITVVEADDCKAWSNSVWLE